MPSAPAVAQAAALRERLAHMEARRRKYRAECTDLGREMLDRALFAAWLAVKREEALCAT